MESPRPKNILELLASDFRKDLAHLRVLLAQTRSAEREQEIVSRINDKDAMLAWLESEMENNLNKEPKLIETSPYTRPNMRDQATVARFKELKIEIDSVFYQYFVAPLDEGKGKFQVRAKNYSLFKIPYVEDRQARTHDIQIIQELDVRISVNHRLEEMCANAMHLVDDARKQRGPLYLEGRNVHVILGYIHRLDENKRAEISVVYVERKTVGTFQVCVGPLRRWDSDDMVMI